MIYHWERDGLLKCAAALEKQPDPSSNSLDVRLRRSGYELTRLGGHRERGQRWMLVRLREQGDGRWARRVVARACGSSNAEALRSLAAKF